MSPRKRGTGRPNKADVDAIELPELGLCVPVVVGELTGYYVIEVRRGSGTD
jgi:hypothetical protein